MNAIQYFNKGFNDYNSGRTSDAETSFTEAIKKDPKYVRAYLRRGMVRSKLGKHTDAVNDFERALRLDPKTELPKTSLESAIKNFKNAKIKVKVKPLKVDGVDGLTIYQSGEHAKVAVNYNDFSGAQNNTFNF